MYVLTFIFPTSPESKKFWWIVAVCTQTVLPANAAVRVLRAFLAAAFGLVKFIPAGVS